MTVSRLLRRLVVVPATGDRSRGFVVTGGAAIPCALGRSGVSSWKKEGDSATPRGSFRLVACLYRSDRIARPLTRLPLTAIRADSGWCDDPADRNYNRAVTLPYAAHHERLWRTDHLYDVIVVIDYNLSPARRDTGSAIFLHIARDDFGPTAGCVAIAPAAMRRLLGRVGPRTSIEIC